MAQDWVQINFKNCFTSTLHHFRCDPFGALVVGRNKCHSGSAFFCTRKYVQQKQHICKPKQKKTSWQHSTAWYCIRTKGFHPCGEGFHINLFMESLGPNRAEMWNPSAKKWLTFSQFSPRMHGYWARENGGKNCILLLHWWWWWRRCFNVKYDSCISLSLVEHFPGKSSEICR